MTLSRVATISVVTLGLACLAPASAADVLVVPTGGDTCASAVPGLAMSQAATLVSAKDVRLNKSWTTSGFSTYEAPARAGHLEFVFLSCGSTPRWSETNYVWEHRSIPIELTSEIGPIRSISARAGRDSPVIRAIDEHGRTVQTDFNPDHPIAISIGIDKGKQDVGFGVHHGGYCAWVIPTTLGPKIEWCHD
jgi:hypothetical protein